MDIEEQRRAVEGARHGDLEAWELLYRNAYGRLWAYSARHAGTDAAEDLVAETMARAVAGIARYRWGPSGFDAWLFGILRHVCADHHRRDSRDRGRPVPSPQSADSGPGDAIELDEEHAQIRRAFERLSESEQQLLELRVIAGLSGDEVARILGKRASAVRTAQSRALAHLRELLGQSW
ncbi:MAG: sigma-70 family RNA polymerase sigma factor [Actinomycetota bacterium]|nr:sigma-70 family RNA polymerase sigma factor [Actinomycetota bacterium]